MAIDCAGALLVETVAALSSRAPAIVAAAARQMEALTLGLHFGDGSHAELRPHSSRLVARAERAAAPDVEVTFDDRALNLLFDLEHRPVDELWAGSLDVRGERAEVLAIWRAFRLLAQRGSGLRAVQALWREYRDRSPERWGALPAVPDPTDGAPARREPSGWAALDYLDRRHPDDVATGNGRGLLGDTVHAASRVLWDGRRSTPWWSTLPMRDADLMETMQACKVLVRDEMMRLVPDREPRAALYDLVREYPSRDGKGLRPTLTVAACGALGGRSEEAVRAAAAIELFHNGFLVHDDIADGSSHRRNDPTLHEAHGLGLAVNAGDALNLLAVDTVLSNLPTLGLARTLALIHEVIHMCRETVEGQAIELAWIRAGTVPAHDEDYFHMSTKKTGWYTCISPCRLGAICAGETDPAVIDRFNEVFRLIGIAFQIQDDVLNLVGDQALYGKEPLGDLLEGKRTIMLIHLFRTAPPRTRARLERIIRLPRTRKRQADAEAILAAMRRHGAIDYAVALADRLAHEGVRRFEADLAFLPDSEAKAVLRQIANYVTTRPL